MNINKNEKQNFFKRIFFSLSLSLSNFISSTFWLSVHVTVNIYLYGPNLMSSINKQPTYFINNIALLLIRGTDFARTNSD